MTNQRSGVSLTDNAIPQPSAPAAAPRTCIDTPGRTIAVSDAVLMDGLNIVAEERAQGIQMHGGILEEFMDKPGGGQAVNIADDNRYAGAATANGAAGQAYRVVTIGRGNMQATLMPSDGGLVAELILEQDESVFMNVGGFTPQGVADYNRDFCEVYSQMDARTMPMLFGFATLDQHMPHRRMGRESLTVRNGHFMRGRLRRANAGVLNLMRSLGEIPGEFDKNIPNLLVMLQSNPDYRDALIARLPDEMATLARKAERLPDCGLALAGLRHGTYFNHSDLDRDGPYVRQVAPLRSLIGIAPDPNKPASDATRRFMDRLATARAKQEAALAAAKATAMLQSAMDKLRKEEAARQARLVLQNGVVKDGPTWNDAIAAIVSATGTAPARTMIATRTRTRPSRGPGANDGSRGKRLARHAIGVDAMPGLMSELASRGLKDASNVRAATLALMEQEGGLTPATTVVDVADRAVMDDARAAKTMGVRLCQRVGLNRIGEAAAACAAIARLGGERGESFVAMVGRIRDTTGDAVVIETGRRLRETAKGSTEYGSLGDIMTQGWTDHVSGERKAATATMAANDDGALVRAA